MLVYWYCAGPKGPDRNTMDKGHKDQDQDRMEFVINALKEFDQKGKERAQDQETTARIVEVDEQDFLQRM